MGGNSLPVTVDPPHVWIVELDYYCDGLPHFLEISVDALTDENYGKHKDDALD